MNMQIPPFLRVRKDYYLFIVYCYRYACPDDGRFHIAFRNFGTDATGDAMDLCLSYVDSTSSIGVDTTVRYPEPSRVRAVR